MDVIDYKDGMPSAGLQKLHATHLAMLRDLLSFCQDIDVRCFLVAGSALGAARHGSFIPWDDDLDVGMLRKDYVRLMIACKERGIRGYQLQTWQNGDAYGASFAKLRKDNTEYKDEFNGLGVHTGIFIDIFPFDFSYRSPVLRRIISFSVAAIDFVILSNVKMKSDIAAGREPSIFRRVAKPISRILPRMMLLRLREKLMTGAQESQELCCYGMYGAQKSYKTMVRVDEVFPLKMAKFSNVNVPIPRDIDAILKRIFGDYNELPSPENRRPSHTGMVMFEN